VDSAKLGKAPCVFQDSFFWEFWFCNLDRFKTISAMYYFSWLWVYNNISNLYLDQKKSHAKSLCHSRKILQYHTVKDDISALWNIAVVHDQDRY